MINYYRILETMNKHKKNRVIIYTITAIAALISIILAVLRCAILIEDNYERQLEQNLADVSYQNAETLRTQIDSIYNLLSSVNARFEMEHDNRVGYVPVFVPVVDAYNIKRIGYVNEKGIAFATDGAGTDLSYRDFFIKGMQGNVYISDILHDALSEENGDIIVMSMPIRNDDGRVEGVTCITYESEQLNESLMIDCFNGDGALFAINKNGHIVVSTDTDIMPITEGFFTDIFDSENNSDDELDKLYTAFTSESEANGKITIHGKNYYYHMTPVRIMDGNTTWYSMSVVPYSYFQARFYPVKRNLYRMVVIVLGIAVFSIIIARLLYRNQRRMTYSLAYESSLTGGPNRARFIYLLNGLKERKGVIAYMNLEDFTHTSIAAGPQKSREIILNVWQIIEKALQPGEFACHDRSDAFVLYLKDEDEKVITERLTELRNIIHRKGHSMDIPWIYSKFGVFAIVNEEDEIENALSKAQYTVFDTWGKKECVSFYNESIHEKVALEKSIEEQFEVAIRDEQLEVWFQPKFSVSGDKLTGAEALIRWRKEDGSIFAPSIFVPVLERTGDISTLDKYVVEHVCKNIKRWREEGIEVVPVSINFSRATLYYQNLVEDFKAILDKYNVDPSFIQIEVTESILGSSEKVIELLTIFRNEGFRILMDDFGTGYSSLSVLNSKCFDVLKVDKSLTDKLEDEYGRTIVYQTIEMATALGLHVTVEGVERKEQLALLEGKDCDIQGYVFSKPLEEKVFETILTEH